VNDKRSTSFWLDGETRELLRDLSEELGMNHSEVMREALRRMRADPKMSTVRRLVAELEREVSGKGVLGS